MGDKPFREPLGRPEHSATGSDVHPRPDSETNLLHLKKGSANQVDVRDLGPLVVGVLPVDEDGNRGRVSDGGSLHVVQACRELPFIKNAITGADGYADVFKVHRDCHNIALGTETSGIVAGLLLPGAAVTVDAFALVGDASVADNIVYNGVYIPAGTMVRVKNQVAGTNSANSFVCVW